jgi:hypothetical protein
MDGLAGGRAGQVSSHVWVLCTDGAQTDLATTYLTISSSVIGSLMTPAHRGVTGAGRFQRSVSGGPSATSPVC